MSEEKENKKIEYNEVIVKDDLDRFIFDDVRENSSKLKEISDSDAIDDQVIDINSKVSSDLFASMFQWDSEIAEDANPTMREVMKTMKGMQEFEEMREYTKSDELSSAIGVNQMFPKVAEQYVQLKKEVEENEEEKKKAEQEGREPNLPNDLKKKKEAMRSQIRSQMQETNKELEDFGNFYDTMGGSNDSKLGKGDNEEKFDLYKKFSKNSKLKEISNLLGRLKNFYKSEQSISYNNANDEIVDIEIGNNIEKLIPSEVVKFNRNKKQFLLDFAEGKLMQYKMRGTETTAKGPIVICVDCSGSMSGIRETWSKAVSLAIADMAIKQDREVDILLYNTRVTDTYKFTKNDKAITNKKIDMISKGCGGGTSFNAPLMAAMDIIEGSGKEESTDIMFVTDGSAGTNLSIIERINEMKEKNGLKVIGLAIQSNYLDQIDEFCDKIHEIDDLNEEESKDVVKEYL